MPAKPAVIVTGTARGSASITATHRKTLELARAGQIGPRATCVAAVATEIDEFALARLRGRVRLTLEAGDRSGSVRGALNPAFRPGDPMVVRRAADITRNALIVDADAAAADLDRELVAELARPDALVRVQIEELGDGPAASLFVHPGSPWAASPFGADDALAPDLELRTAPSDSERSRALALLRAGGRVLLSAARTGGPSGEELIWQAHEAGYAVLPVPGLSPLAAVVAVAGAGSRNVCLSAAEPAAQPSPGYWQIVIALPGDRVSRLLTGAKRGLIALDVGTPREQYLPWSDGTVPAIAGGRSRSAIMVIAPAGGSSAGADDRSAAARLDPGIAALASAMLARGAPVRELALALRDATGWARGDAYRALIELKADARDG